MLAQKRSRHLCVIYKIILTIIYDLSISENQWRCNIFKPPPPHPNPQLQLAPLLRDFAHFTAFDRILEKSHKNGQNLVVGAGEG